MGRSHRVSQPDATQRPKLGLDVEITAPDPHFPRSSHQLERRWREAMTARGGHLGQVQQPTSAILGLLYVFPPALTPMLTLQAREFRERVGLTPLHRAHQVRNTSTPKMLKSFNLSTCSVFSFFSISMSPVPFLDSVNKRFFKWHEIGLIDVGPRHQHRFFSGPLVGSMIPKPPPSKWDDADKWIVSPRRKQSPTQPQQRSLQTLLTGL